ncbi:hypothetical protein RBU49_06845 [Clostridium sp. MB40-C1]|uniref:hypothetical protein n=1 Tax=Clostridium sp. MB40-C1 TaxID=3070996 RepID=UPI0027E041DF|nr:hypothetical protein [Clostridium sp. MB40-C1]WMJ81960.1 hypothetical protein RBU49_06845 [Clostridium sp. MB40-C1]
MKPLKTKGLETHGQLGEIHKDNYKNNKRNKNNEKLSTRDIEELMSHSCYRRIGGVFRQIK